MEETETDVAAAEENALTNSAESVQSPAENSTADGTDSPENSENSVNGEASAELKQSESETAAADAAAAENLPKLVVDGLSAEQNVSRLQNLTKIPKNKAVYTVSVIYIILGLLCVSITKYITYALPYIVGSVMILIGVVGFILSLVHRSYRDIKTNKLFTYVICVALGIFIILSEIDPENDPIMLISIIWGVFGLFEGAHALNHAVTKIANSERCVYYIVRGIVECAVAFMLLYRPESHSAHFFHIVVFGINLIFDGVTMIPKVKEILTKF